MEIKVKIIAIAKDEAPYIADWIAHHIYFGFDEIEILINRTTDNSESILSTISSVNKKVKWRSVDWVDLIEGNVSRDIQKISYAQAYAEAKNDFSHVIFLDIDEFWVPANYSDSITDCIVKLGHPDAVYFEWMNELGHTSPFTSIQRSHQYRANELGKTLFATKLPLNKISIHRHFFKGKINYILADGSAFESATEYGQEIHAQASSLKSFFIIHRLNRSEEEYISLLYRGNPENSSEFKNNRFGYNIDKRKILAIEFNEAEWNKYENFINFQISSWALHETLPSSRSALIDKYLLSVSKINEAIRNNHKNFLMTSILTGLSERHKFLKPSEDNYQGFVDSATSNQISGWAVDPFGNPCQLTLFINDLLFLEIVTNSPRKDLMSQGISNGMGGFKVSLPEGIKPGSKYSVFFKNNTLMHSGALSD